MAKKKVKSAAPGVLGIGDFTAPQNQALLDLFVLAMYMDGNLAQVEEARVQQLLTAMGFETDYDRNREFDASVTRIRRQTQTPAAMKDCAAKLAANFTSQEQQQRVYDFLAELAGLDGRVSAEESKFLISIKEAFKM
jgi:hypothetical protein